ncbi:MAG: hypothetical protein M1122_01770 [Candidatus Marsarchaeota archaeon]|nr:hypothetical protein [Candidatus Marsarchaeota archaeon]
MHERDAMSAAMSAYNKYANKINQAENMAKETGMSDVDTVKALVIKKHSVYEALIGKKSRRFVR